METEVIDNPRYPHKVKITRMEYPADEFDPTPAKERVLYNGAGRGFTDTTTEGGKGIDENKRKASIPVRFDEWRKPVLKGDKIKITKGRISEDGEVYDFEPDNNRTIIYWNLVRQ